MFEYFGHILVYSPGPGAANPQGQNIFININLLSICSFLASFLPFNDIFLFLPIQMHGRPKLTLPYNGSGSSQGHELCKLGRSPLPDASFQVSKS